MSKSSVIACPDCGKLISLRFPYHECLSVFSADKSKPVHEKNIEYRSEGVFGYEPSRSRWVRVYYIFDADIWVYAGTQVEVDISKWTYDEENTHG